MADPTRPVSTPATIMFRESVNSPFSQLQAGTTSDQIFVPVATGPTRGATHTTQSNLMDRQDLVVPSDPVLVAVQAPRPSTAQTTHTTPYATPATGNTPAPTQTHVLVHVPPLAQPPTHAHDPDDVLLLQKVGDGQAPRAVLAPRANTSLGGVTAPPRYCTAEHPPPQHALPLLLL